jgi:uncharacterized membrane protein (UPF0127 family)
MDVEHLRQKLHPDENQEQGLKEKVNKHSTAIRVVVGTIIVMMILTAVSFIQAPKKAEGAPQACFKHDVCVNLTIATTQDELEIGLGNYSSLPPDTGMLFVFEKPGVQRMWMKDMKFPIDIIWISGKSRITHIEKSADPCIPPQCLVYEPAGLAKYVLEVRSGFARDDNLFDNDVVELRNIPG